MQASEREERAAEREIRKAEMERDVKMRELDLRERVGGIQSKSGTNLKSRLPKFQEGQDPDIRN